MAISVDQPTVAYRRGPRPWWSVATALLAIALFLQGVFAGAMLSGFEWARMAHAVNGAAAVVATLAAGLVALATLRRTPGGVKLALTLLALAVVVFVQFALGRMAAKGANLMWLHVPLGVALVALAGRAAASARVLGAGK